MKNFAAFYKEYGVRTPTLFRSPFPKPITQLSKGAILHLPPEKDKDFPDPSLPFFQKLANKVWLFNELSLLDDHQAARFVKIEKTKIVRDWVTNNKKTFAITIKPVGALTDENQLVAVNYGLIDNGYHYAESKKLSRYDHWADCSKKMWTRIAEICRDTQRQNFIVMQAPTEIPSLSSFRRGAKGFTATELPFFDDDVKMSLLDIWNWLSLDSRPVEATPDNPNPLPPIVKSNLSLLRVEDLPRVNLLFRMFDGTSVVINLGYLNSWIKGQPNQTDQSSAPQKTSDEIQMDFMKFLISVQNYNLEQEKSAREAQELAEDDRQSDDVDQPADTITERDESDEDDYGSDFQSPNRNSGATIGSDATDPSSIASSLAKAAANLASDDTRERVEETATEDLDEDLKALEELEKSRVKARSLLEEDNLYDPEEGMSEQELQMRLVNPPGFGEEAVRVLDRMVDLGTISAAEYRKITKSIENFKNMPDPFTGKGTIIEAATVKPEDLQFDTEAVKLVDPLGVASESIKESRVEELDRAYVANVMRKEVLGAIIGCVKMGVIVENLEFQQKETIEGGVLEAVMTLKPIGGRSSTIRLKIPYPDLDGSFTAKGVRYHSRKQINDVNERKIQGDEVGLTTYTSKLFINRSRAKAHNPAAYISKHLTRAQMGEVSGIKRVRSANVSDRLFKSPFIYSTLSEHFKGFTIDHKVFGEIQFDLEHRTRHELIDQATMTQVEKGGNILCGVTAKGLPVFVTPSNEFMVRTPNGDESVGNIYKVLDLDEAKAPVGYSEMSLLGKSVGTGVVMARQMGFRNLLKLTKCKYRLVEGRSARLEDNEFKVRFRDRIFIFSKDDPLACLIFGGFKTIEKEIKNYPAISFDSKEVYDAVLESQDLTQMHMREIENLENGFIDPISLRRLKAVGGSQTFMGMLFKACQELTHNQAPETQDTDSQQILGYERFAGTIHREMYKAIRSFRNQNSTGRAKINMSHYAIWQSIMEDGTIKTCEDINPIQNLKMHESLTFAGEGGRSRETFNLAARAFNIKAVGIHSESTPDSGDVAYNVFTSWNPAIKDLNGTRDKDVKDFGYGHILSTSLNLVAEPNRNDMKRNVFTAIQNSHTVACNGYGIARVLTGAEGIIGQRTDSLFCKTAKQDGKVVAITATGLIVEYADKTREGVELGRRYGDAEGTTYPHDLVTHLKVGEKVKKGETLAYNTGYFQPNPLNPRFSIMKFGTYATVAFQEVPETHEDSCSITEEFAGKLITKGTDPRSYVLRFTQNVHDVLKPGTVVDPDTVLMVIEDEITSGSGVFDAQSTTTLGRLGRNAPRAGHTGVLDRIECVYHGDKADLSPSLRKLVDASDRYRAEVCKSIGKPVITGRATSDWSVEGKPLQLDQVEVIFYITVEKTMGNADKLVFSEQLKSTVGKVETRKIVTESGRKVDAIFAGSSVIKRIVLTVVNNGSTIVLMDACEKEAVKAFFGK